MFTCKLIGFICCLSFTFGGIVQAQSVRDGDMPTKISRERRADIKCLLELMGVIDDEMKSLEPVFENIKRSFPNVPSPVWEDLKKEFIAEFTPEMFLETYLPIYARRFSATEVKEFIKFFESPAGRKFVGTMPLIREEAYIVGFERGQKIGRRLQERLRAKGYAPSET